MNLTTYVRLSKKVVQWYLNHPVVVVDVQCDQMPDIKSCPNVFKSCLNNFQTSFYIYWSFSKKPKSQQSFGATFDSEFVAKNFRKSPNLVTLSTSSAEHFVRKLLDVAPHSFDLTFHSLNDLTFPIDGGGGQSVADFQRLFGRLFLFYNSFGLEISKFWYHMKQAGIYMGKNIN